MFATRAQRPSQARRTNRPSLEALEQRLVLSWGGTPPSSIVPPSNAVAVSLNSQGDAAGAATIATSENDYYTFVAPTGGSYRIAATTPSSSVDTVLGVFSNAGTRIAYNDDISSSNRDSQVTVTLAAGSRYYFGITSYSGTRGGAYSWAVDGPAIQQVADDSFEDNDTRATASGLGTLTAPRTVSNLVMADSADWFSFTTTAAGASDSSVSISFQNGQGDLGLELVDASGQVLAASNTAGNVETVSLAGFGAGTYFVRAFGTGGATNPSYTLTVAPPAGGTTTPTPGAFDIVIRASGLTATQQLAFDNAAARWESIIVGDLPNATYNGIAVDDLLIDASSVAIDGPGGVLGQAGPDSIRSASRLPIHGTMQFDTADLASMESNGTLTEVILHEMGHVLGIGTIWQMLGLLSGAGTANPQFLGTRAIAEYNAIFGTNASGVPVEGTPAPAGTRDGHWRESLFGNELMTGYISAASNPISRITVASLADIGYTVNMAAADSYTPTSSAIQVVQASTGTRQAGLVLGTTTDIPATTPPARRPAFTRSFGPANHGPRDVLARWYA
ncbi:pre-peptidase C-terminal domain-containing protein [Tundrisphaera sp. TA3]|uniref:PPC domain-containing protein n=1 Tax=Tundrisphaera sp. TA3 TaxID=3435775 RepID=UPI003EB9C232